MSAHLWEHTQSRWGGGIPIYLPWAVLRHDIWPLLKVKSSPWKGGGGTLTRTSMAEWSSSAYSPFIKFIHKGLSGHAYWRSKYEENEWTGSHNENLKCSEGQISLDTEPLGPSFYNGKISHLVLHDKNEFVLWGVCVGGVFPDRVCSPV